ncbi:MAG: alpha/beta hydrolase domain-containing protein [Acidimicrobiia bacterium]
MDGSGITAVEVAGVDGIGVFADVRYERVWGTVRGVIASHEDVVGLDRLPSPYEYESEFEVLRPVDRGQRSAVLVDAENRGGPSMLGLVTGVPLRGSPPSAVTYPVGMGDGCLFDTGLAYARVQWQTDHCASVPADAQGIGLVIVRDFGRYLADDFDQRVLAGASQSAWFVNTLIAEGFNVDPVDGTGVYGGALAYLSAGNWLALNRLADDGAPQYPYVRPERAPLTAAEILSRPESDPFFVDITSYTEYYRLRGSVFASASLPAPARHYDFPAPHAPAMPILASAAFELMGCNGGVEIPLNPIQSGAYARALLVGLVADPDALPPSSWFELGPAPEPSEYFNALPGVMLQVPRVDADAQPIGGVRFPDVELPLGRAEPVALPPCGASSITDACGNFGGWQPFSASELARRYGSVDAYAERYAKLADSLLADGFLLPRDRDIMIESARRHFTSAT